MKLPSCLLVAVGLLIGAPALVHGGNTTMSVLVVVRPPFAIYDPDKSGNEAFSGFIVELFQQVVTQLGTNYTFKRFTGHGSSEALAELTNDPVSVDMILGDIMITKQRLKLVDFTVPYISMPLNVITRTREAEKNIFGFLKPFAWQVWMLLLIMMFCYGLFMYVVESPENQEYFPRDGYHAVREASWHAAMMSVQDRDKPIVSTGGKLATATYALCIVIVLAAYTANLAATMSSEHIPEVVKSKHQLHGKLTALWCGGATENYCAHNNVVGRVLCKYSDQAIASAIIERSADAGLMNSLQAEYVASQSCGLHIVPGIELDSKPYALPVQKGWISDYAEFNRWLVQMVMDGTIDRLTKKWFKDSGKSCKSSSNKQIDYDSMYGLAIFLLIGILLSLGISSGVALQEKYHLVKSHRPSDTGP